MGAVDDLTYKREVTEKPDKVPVVSHLARYACGLSPRWFVVVIGKQRVVVDWSGAFPC